MYKITIHLTKIGESTTEAKIVEWLKKPGDFVKKDENFLIIGTDKVDAELPSEYEGQLLEVLVNEGDDVAVGDAIAIIESETPALINTQENTKSIPKSAVTTSETTSKVSGMEKNTDKGFLSPLVRKMALENNLSLEDLSKIKASGENGRIQKKDIEAYLQPKKTANKWVEEKLELAIEAGDETLALTKMRKAIAQNMAQAWSNIPHVTTFIDTNVTQLVNYREANKDNFLQEHGIKLTYTHFIMKAVIDALKLYPQFNAWFNGEELILKHNINLGFATALADGNLIVPNIKMAQNMSVVDLAKSVSEIGQLAKSNKLKLEDTQNTTFTVSNTGIFGSKMGTPIISRPQVAVLALGAILRAPAVILKNGEEILAIQSIMALSISYDHRVIDGALASKFLMEIKKRIEEVGS